LHQLARRYDLYRGFFRGNYAQFRNNIQLPTLFSIIQADVARKVQALLGGDRFIDFVARSSTDGSFARKVSSLVNAQLHDCNTVSKGQDFFLTADMYGTAFARHGWKTVRRLEQFRKLDETGQKEMIASGVVTRFDGPNWDVLDPLDVWPQPGRKRIEDCRWVMVRYFMDLDELELLSQVGVYDKAAVARLKSTSSPTGFVDDSYRIRRQLYRNMSDYDARMQEQYNKVVECVDMFGYVPDEFAPDGFTFRMITTGNDVVVLRNKPFPFWHGQIPIIAYSPMADPHYIHGVGKIEITERLQYLANRWVSQKADAVDLVIDPMWLVNRQAGVDTQNLYTRAGRVIGVDGAVDDSVIRPLSPDMRGLPLADQEIKGLWGWMQQSTGMIEDTMMGGPSSREQTATEYGGRTQAVLTRQMLELLLAGNLWLEPLANTFHQYNRQFLKMPKEVMLIGEDAEIDPITGLAQPPTMQQVGLQDLNMDYRAVSSGAANMIGKQARRNDIMALTGLLQQNPVAGQAMNWVAWLRYVMTVFDLPNTKDFFATGQVPGVNQVAESTGQSPESVVGMAGGRQPLVNMMMGGQGG
jgi:hypothetical protein